MESTEKEFLKMTVIETACNTSERYMHEQGLTQTAVACMIVVDTSDITISVGTMLSDKSLIELLEDCIAQIRFGKTKAPDPKAN